MLRTMLGDFGIILGYYLLHLTSFFIYLSYRFISTLSASFWRLGHGVAGLLVEGIIRLLEDEGKAGDPLSSREWEKAAEGGWRGSEGAEIDAGRSRVTITGAWTDTAWTERTSHTFGRVITVFVHT